MLPILTKRSFFTLLFAIFAFLTIFYFPQPFPPNAYALDSNNCENGWTFNGGDAGDDNNWEYTGCGQDDGGSNDNNDDENNDDNGNGDRCDEERWTDEDSGGDYDCRDGKVCFRKWERSNSCDIQDNGWDCKSTSDDDRCSNSSSSNNGNIEAGYCENGWTFKGGDAGDDNAWSYTACGEPGSNSDNSESDCNAAGGTWKDNRCFTAASSNDIKAGDCENGWTFKGGDAGDNNSWEYTACGLGQVDSDTNEQECNKAGGSWSDNRCYTAASSDIKAGGCENGWLFKGGDAGDNNSWEYNGCADANGSTGESDGACPSNQYWDTNTGGCANPDVSQAETNDQIYCREECDGSCNGSLGAKYCTNSDGSRKYDCSNKEDQWKAECQNQLLDEFENTGIEPANINNGYQACGFADLADSGCVGVEYCRLHILYCDGEPRGEAKPGGSCELVAGKCGVAEDENGNKFVAETGQPAVANQSSENPAQTQTASGPNPEELQKTKDASCKETNTVNHYCDGNICIEQSSGWDGAACVNVYSTVNASQCTNSCAGNNATSGQEIKLLSCIDEEDAAKRAECQKENTRIAQTGQKLDQASLIRASLTVDDCVSLADEAKSVCEEKNKQTRELGRVLNNISLESCSTGSEQEKKDCNQRNQQAIKVSQNRQSLGIKDCSGLTGDAKTNCDFENYQKNQIAEVVSSLKQEDCALKEGEAEINACKERNKQTYQDAVANSSSFIGKAELGSVCVYTEACAEGGKKACAGKVENDNGAPVCKYNAEAASCSACTTEPLNLMNKENKCSDTGECLNAPGLVCLNNLQCQARQQAQAQAAAAPENIDPSKYFSQKFAEGAECRQVQLCDLEDGTPGEQVCSGKGANDACDLSQGGGVCSVCQVKGSVKLNQKATCNPQTYKCEGAPAIEGCLNDDQCKPPPPVSVRVPTGSSATAGGYVDPNGQIYAAVQQCRDLVDNTVAASSNYSNCQAESARAIAAGDLPNCDQYAFGAAVSQKAYPVCVTHYVATGRLAYTVEERQQPVQLPPETQKRVNEVSDGYLQANLQYSQLAQTASIATNQYLELERQVRDGKDVAATDPLDHSILLNILNETQLKAAQENARLLEVQSSLNTYNQNLGLNPVQDIAGKNITQVDQNAPFFEQEIGRRQSIVDTRAEVTQNLAEAQKIRLQYERSNDYNPDSVVSSNAKPEDDPLYRQRIQAAETGLNQLTQLKAPDAQLQHALDYLPSKTDQVRSTERIVESGTQMANLLDAHAQLNGQTNVGREEVEFLQDAGLSYVDKLRTQGGAAATAQANQLEARVGNSAYNAWVAEYQQEFKAGKSLDPDENNSVGGIINGLNKSVGLIAVADPAKAEQLRVQARVLPEILAAQEYSDYVKKEIANKQLTADEKSALDVGFNTIVAATVSKAGDGAIVGDMQDKYASAVVEGTAQAMINARLANARAGNIEPDDQAIELSNQFRTQVVEPLTAAGKPNIASQLQNSFNSAPSVGSAQGNINLATRLAINDAGNPDKDLSNQTTALENARLSLSILPDSPEKAKLQTNLTNFNQNVSTILERKRAVDLFQQDVTWAAYNAANQNNSATTAERVDTARARFDALPDDLKADPVLAAQANSLDTIAKIGNQRDVMNDWYQAAAQAKADGDEAGYQAALEKARNVYGATVADTVSLPQNLRTGALVSLTGEANTNELEVGTKVTDQAAELAGGRVEQSAARLILPAKAIAGMVVQADTAVKCFTVYSLTEGCQAVRNSTVAAGSQLAASAQSWLNSHPGSSTSMSSLAAAVGQDIGVSLVQNGITATDSTRSSSEKMQAGLATLNATGDLSAAMRAAGLSTQYGIWNTDYYDTPQVKQRAEETASQVGILPKNYEQMLKAGQMTQEQVDAAMRPENWSSTQKQAFFAFLPHEDPNPLKWLSNNLLNAAIDVNPFIHQGSAQLICADTYGSLCYSGFGESISMTPEDYTKANRVLSEVFPGYTPSDYQSFSTYANAKASCMSTGSGAANNEFCTSHAVKQLGLTPDEATKLEKDFNAYGYAAEYVKNNTEPGKFAWEMQLNVSESVGNTAVTAAIALPIAAATGGTGFASLTGLDVLQIVPALARGGAKLASVGVREILPEAAGLLRESVGAAVDAPWSQKVPAFLGPEIWDAPKYAKNADDAVTAARQSVIAAQDNLLRMEQARTGFTNQIAADPALQNDPGLTAYIDLANTRVNEAESTLVAAYSASGQQVNDLVRYDQSVFDAQIRFNDAQSAFLTAERNELPVSQIDAIRARAEEAAATLQGARTGAIIRDLGATVSEVDSVRLAQDRVDNLQLFQQNGATVDPVRLQIARSDLVDAQAQAIQNQYGIPLDQTPQVASIPPPSPTLMERFADGLSSLAGRFSRNTPITTAPAPQAATVAQTSVDPALLSNVRDHPDVRGYGVSSDATGQKVTVNYRDGRPAEEFTPDQLRADARFNPNANTAQAPNTGATANNAQPNPAQSQPQPAAPNNAAPQPNAAQSQPAAPGTNTTVPPVAQVAPQPTAGFFDPVRNLWNRVTGQTPQQPIVIDTAQRAQQRAQAESIYQTEKAAANQLQTEYDVALKELEEARIANEHARAYLADVSNRNLLQQLVGSNQSAIGAAQLRQGLTQKELNDAKAALETISQKLTPQKTKTLQAELAKGELTAEQYHQLRIQATQEYLKAKKTLSTNNQLLDPANGQLFKEVDAAYKGYSQVYKDLFNLNKTPNPVEEAQLVESWKAYNRALDAASGDANAQSVKDAAANLTLGTTKLSPQSAEKLVSEIQNINIKIDAVNSAQRQSLEAAQIVNNYPSQRDLLRQVTKDSRLEQTLIARQNQISLREIESALSQQGINGKTEVKLFIDSNGELLLTPDAGTNPQNVIGIFNKSGDSVKLESIVIPETLAPQAGQTASAVYAQLESITPRNWYLIGKNIEIEKNVSGGTTRFQSRFDNASPVNIQAATPQSTVPTPATPVNIEREAVADLISVQRVYYDINTGKTTLANPVSDDQIRAALVRQGMSDTDPDLAATIQRISDEINPKVVPAAPASSFEVIKALKLNETIGDTSRSQTISYRPVVNGSAGPIRTASEIEARREVSDQLDILERKARELAASFTDSAQKTKYTQLADEIAEYRDGLVVLGEKELQTGSKSLAGRISQSVDSGETVILYIGASGEASTSPYGIGERILRELAQNRPDLKGKIFVTTSYEEAAFAAAKAFEKGEKPKIFLNDDISLSGSQMRQRISNLDSSLQRYGLDAGQIPSIVEINLIASNTVSFNPLVTNSSTNRVFKINRAYELDNSTLIGLDGGQRVTSTSSTADYSFVTPMERFRGEIDKTLPATILETIVKPHAGAPGSGDIFSSQFIADFQKTKSEFPKPANIDLLASINQIERQRQAFRQDSNNWTKNSDGSYIYSDPAGFVDPRNTTGVKYTDTYQPKQVVELADGTVLIVDSVNLSTIAKISPETTSVIPPAAPKPVQVQSTPFAQAVRDVSSNPRTNNSVYMVVDGLGDQLDAFYISLENNLRHASARSNLDQLAEIRSLLIQAETRLDQVKPEYTNAVQQQKLILDRVEEARVAGTLTQEQIGQANRELAPFNETLRRLKPIYQELENEIIPGIRAEYRIPSATVVNRVGEELTRRGINPNLLSDDAKIELYLHLKQANTIAAANPASVPPVEQAIQNGTGAVQAVVDTAGDVTESVANTLRNTAASAPAPVQTIANSAADAIDDIAPSSLSNVPLIGTTANAAAEALEEAAQVARLLGNDSLADSLEAQSRLLKGNLNNAPVTPLTGDSVVVDDSADLINEGTMASPATSIPVASRVDDAVRTAVHPVTEILDSTGVSALIDDLAGLASSGKAVPQTLSNDQLRALNDSLSQAIKDGRITPELADFWRGMVRDAGEVGPDGNLRQAHPYISPDGRYFYGYQPTVDLSNGNFINSNIALRRYVTESLANPTSFNTSGNFFDWLRAAHQEIAYKPNMRAGELVPGSMESGGHFEIVDSYVSRVARDLNDPYYTNLMTGRTRNIKVEQVLQLPGISAGGASKDVNYIDGLNHYYPNPRYTNEYFEQMRLRMQLLTTDKTLTLDQQLQLIAETYQYGVVARSFKEVNNSLYLGIANTLLAERGLKPVSAGFLDFAAMRLQQGNFTELFFREVEKTNPSVSIRRQVGGALPNTSRAAANRLRDVAESIYQSVVNIGMPNVPFVNPHRVASGINNLADHLDNGARNVTPSSTVIQQNREALLSVVPDAGFNTERSLLGFGPVTMRANVLMWIDQNGKLFPITEQVSNTGYVVVSYIKNQNATVPRIEKITAPQVMQNGRLEVLKGSNIPVRQAGSNEYWEAVFQAATDAVGLRLRNTGRAINADNIQQAAAELNLHYISGTITPRVRQKFGQPATVRPVNPQPAARNNAPVGRQFGVEEIQADSIVGGRSYQEDMAALPLITEDGRVGIFGVYDGHGGAYSSQIAADNLAITVQENLARGMTPEQALHNAYLQIDRIIKDQRLNDGSTGITVLVQGNTLYSANAGDARAVMSRDGRAMRLSTDHKSSDPGEIARIQQEGGRVGQDDYGTYRVAQEGRSAGGGVAVARALGDHQFPGITAVPTINRVTLGAKDEFTIIATDGFWDIFSDQQAVTRARQLLSNPNTTPYEVSSILAREAHGYGSADNITVQIIPLKNQNTTARFNELVQGRGTCQIGAIPTSATLATVNTSANVLGVSTGEVLAASTGSCGPLTQIWLEVVKSPPNQLIDKITGGKLVDAYTDLLVKVDASLPEPILKAGNQVINFIKKLGGATDSQLYAPDSQSILNPVIKNLVEDVKPPPKKLSAEIQFISDYFDKIKSRQIDQGRYLLYYDTQNYRFEIDNLSSSDKIIPVEIQVIRQADLSLQIPEIKLPGGWETGSVSMEIVDSLEQLTGNKIPYITGVSWQSLKVSESVIPSIIRPNLTTVLGQLVTNPDAVRLYANRQIEQNWLNRSLETLLGDNYLPLKQLALPAPDPLIATTRQLDSVYSLYKSGDIDEAQLIKGVESIAGIQTPTQKIQEVPLFIDERFLRTGLVAGRDIEDIKHWFGGGEWAGWLGARTIAQAFGDRPLTTGFIQNLHEALLLPATPKADVLIGEFREKSITGFKKANPGQFPIAKIEAINSNPYIKFIETPSPEGVVATSNETKWGYLQYPQSRDAEYIDSLPDYLKAKLPPRPTNQELVQVLVDDAVQWYNAEKSKAGVDQIALAAELQRRLVSVHPFGDANGRLSRVVMNWALENSGYPAPRVVNFNADIETPLPQWIEIVRDGVAREQKVIEKLKLMEEIGYVDQVEALGYSELKTFYDLVSRDGSFANNLRSLPEVNGIIVSKPSSRLGDLDREIALAWNEFHRTFSGESQVLEDGTKINAGGLVPQSYIDLVRMRNPQNFVAYDKLINNFYSNREIPTYRGIQISTPADTPQRVAALFETPRSGLNSYYSNTFSSPKSPRFLRLENPNMPATDVYWESMAKGLEDYNATVIDDYLDLREDNTIQMEDKSDSLRRKIKIHTQGHASLTEVSPFVSLSVSEVVASNFAGASYNNPFFNTLGKPTKKQAGILVTSKLPAKGVIPTFNTNLDGWPVPPQIIPSLGANLTIHIGEKEILVPGGMNPVFMERIQVKVRPTDAFDKSWRSFRFDAEKMVKDDGIYVQVKELDINADGFYTGEVKNINLFKLNPLTGKYEEVKAPGIIETALESVGVKPEFVKSSLDTFLGTPMTNIVP